MEEFEKKFKKFKKGNSKIGWFFVLIAIILVIIGILTGNQDKESWENFNGMSSDEYHKVEIYYLVGPFAEYREENEVKEELYSALTVDNNYILVKTAKDTDLPILGEDVTEENIDSIKPVKIYGYGEKLDASLESYLIQFWNEVYEEEALTKLNYKQYFGDCYLDTTNQSDGTDIACYIFAFVFGVLAIIILSANRKNDKNRTNTLKKLEEDGILEGLKSEYSKDTIQEYKKIKLEMTENYIVSFVPELVVVPFANIVNAYHSNMRDGVYEPCMYIALETKNNEKYYVAQKQLGSKNPQFDEALEKIKSKVMQGGN